MRAAHFATATATALSLLAGCATLAEKNESKLTISETSSEADFTPVTFTGYRGLTPYTFGKVAYAVEWSDCRTSNPQATVLIMHQDRAGFEAMPFCNHWLAQTFLSQGFDVVMVNRPGYGASTGMPDFAGAQSMAAVAAAVPAAVTSAKNPKPVTGAWGYETGASAAALAAKHLSGLTFLILGGGVYDYEDALKNTADSYLKKDLETIRKTGGEKAIEERSVGYDVSGLPHRIAIYHAKQDTTVPPAEAKAFADSLESNGAYKVNLQIIDGIGHDIPPLHHRKLLEVLAHSVLN